MQKEYPSFIYNNEKFIMLPGTRFTKNEILTRLHLMGVKENKNKDKLYLVNLYESTLKNNENKLKILPQLRKDTDNLNAKLNMSERASLPTNNVSMNVSQKKIMNISQEVIPFNSKEPKINLVTPINTNVKDFSQNPFFSNNVSLNQSNNAFNGDFSNNNLNSLNNNNLSNINKNNNYPSSFISTQEIHLKKNNDNSVVSNSNNNDNQIFNPKVQERINRDSINTLQYIKTSKRYEEDEEDFNNNNLKNNYPNNKKSNIQYESQQINNFGNNNQIDRNENLTYQENNYTSNMNKMSNKNNISNTSSINNNSHINDNRKTYTNFPNESQYSENNQYMLERKNNLDNRRNYANEPNINQFSVNSQNFYGSNSNLNNSNTNDNIKTYTNLPSENQFSESNPLIFNSNNNLNATPSYSNSINVQNPYVNNSRNIPNSNDNINQNVDINTQIKHFYGKGDNNLTVKNNSNIEKEPDEASTFSFFSNFKNNFRSLKNKPFYKNKKFICFHALLLILIICLTIGILNLINYTWDSIINFFELLLHPVDLINAIGSFFTSLVLGASHYWYLTIPFIILVFAGFLFFKNYYFKQRIKKIFQKIKKDLMNNTNISNENGVISEDDIYERYVKKYGVSKKEYTKKYLPKLRKMREKDSNLKSFQNNINNKYVFFWEFPL